MKFPIKDFFNENDHMRRNLQIWSHLLKKSLMRNFIFCAVYAPNIQQICLKIWLQLLKKKKVPENQN